MIPAKPGHWETVKSRTAEKKQRTDDKKKAEVKTDRLGVKQDPFAAWDKAYADTPKPAKEPVKAESHGSYKGAYAGLTDEAPPVRLQQPDIPQSDESGTEEAAANGNASATVSAKAKKPKVKKPKITISSIAESVDIPGLQSILAELQERYATNETSQLEMLSDTLLRTFKEASADLDKLLATKGLDQAAEFPLNELPHVLHNALASFVASCHEAAMQSVVVSLIKATTEPLEGQRQAKGAPAPGPATKGKAGLLIMLAIILRTRPQVLISCAPQLRAMGPALTSGPRMLQLLWVLQQTAAADVAVTVAVWMRLLLPQILGATDLPCTSSSTKGKPAEGGAVAGPAQVPAMDAAAAEEGVEYLRSLLRAMGPAGTGLVTLGDGSQQAVVPGAALELITRATHGNAEGGAGSSKKSKGAPSAAVLQTLQVIKEPLRVLAGSGAAITGPMQEWLVLAFETAALSEAAPTAPDDIVFEATANVLTCLGANDSAFSLWETKHKGLLKGTARVLVAISKKPSLLQPLTRQRGKADQLRELLAALPTRHRSHLAAGKGWQGACAKAADDACKVLTKKVGSGGRSKRGSGGSGGASAVLVLLGGTAAAAGVIITAAVYRREVGGIVSHYAGKDFAQQLDSAVLGPLSEVIQQATVAAEPYLAQAKEIAEPYWLQVEAVAGPKLQQLQEAAQPHLETLQVAAQPYVEQLHAKVAPAVEELGKLQQYLLQQLDDVWQKAKQG